MYNNIISIEEFVKLTGNIKFEILRIYQNLYKSHLYHLFIKLRSLLKTKLSAHIQQLLVASLDVKMDDRL